MNTPERRSTDALRESFSDAQLQVDALRRLLDFSGLALARVSRDGRILYATPRFASLLGSTVENLATRPIREFIPDDSFALLDSELSKNVPQADPVFMPTITSAGESPMLWTFRRVILADTTQELHLTIQKVRNEDTGSGLPAHLVNPVKSQPTPVTGRYLQDITPWENEQTARLHAELSQCGAWVMDLASNSIIWSESAFITLGLDVPPEGQPHSMGFEQWVHEDDLQRVTETLYERFVSPGPFDIDARGLHRDGRVRYINARGITYKTDETKETPDRAFGIFIDQTDEILAARTLNMTLRIDAVLARAKEGYGNLAQDIVNSITESGGFSYAAYHQCGPGAITEVIAYSGTNKFMATEERKRVREALASGKPANLTETSRGTEITLAVVLPVSLYGKPEGVLVVWSNEAGQFTHYVMDYLSSVTANMGTLMERLDNWERTQSVLRNLTNLFGVAIESHSPFESGRHARVATVSRAIAEQLEMAPTEIFGIEIAASIYDMGMLWLPDRLTTTPPDALTPEDTLETHRHTLIGQSLAENFDWPFPVPEVMGQHHERWDGSGYPRGLAGEAISLSARVVAVASAYERLSRSTGDQPGNHEEALNAVMRLAGSAFDPRVVDALAAATTRGFVFKA